METVYEAFSPRKRVDGTNVSTFWDKQCLVYGQNWQEGFVRGLRGSKVILLLVSAKVNYFFLFFSNVISNFVTVFGRSTKKRCHKTRQRAP